jgi:hypothetical protein
MRRALVVAGLCVALAAVPGAALASEPEPGAVSGHVVTSAPDPVTVDLFTTAGASQGQIFTDADGSFVFPSVPPGTYKVLYDYQGRYQWSHEKLGFSAADVVTVAPGETTTVTEETMLTPGVVEVVVTDSVSGAPVDQVCVEEPISTLQCGAADGVLWLTGLADGAHTLLVRSSDGLHSRKEVTGVTVALGQTTRVEVALQPTVAITATVVDRATGEPVPGACVAPLMPAFGKIGSDRCSFGRDLTDVDGRLTVGELPAGDYNLLVLPQDNVHGAQWVGRRGGTGNQYAAVTITGVPGQLSTAPIIRLDPKASITGTIRDAETGEPLPNGCAGILPYEFGSLPYVLGLFCTQFDTGTYTIPNLGPYDWPVQFLYYYEDNTAPYARVWSGGASDRKAATRITAGVETPGVADATLAKIGIRLGVRAVTEDGQAWNGGIAVKLYNARTGDLVKSATTSYGSLEIAGIIDQRLRLEWFAPGIGHGWYGGTDFASSKNIRLENGGRVDIKLNLPNPS